jgi:hypothetical protein
LPFPFLAPYSSARRIQFDHPRPQSIIDPLIALAMAALAAVERKNVAEPIHGYSFGSSPWEALYALVGERGPRAEDIPSFDVGLAQRDGSPLPQPITDLNATLQKGVVR